MIMDFKISLFLPSLSQCSKPPEVSFVKDFLPTCSLKNLLKYTSNMRQLTLGKYPAHHEDIDDILYADLYNSVLSLWTHSRL